MSWKRIAPSLTEDVKLLLVKQIILSKIDYSNSLFTGLPNADIKSLQAIVNCEKLASYCELWDSFYLQLTQVGSYNSIYNQVSYTASKL